MPFDARIRGIGLIRQWAQDEAELVRAPWEVYRDLRSSINSILEEFRVQFDLEGVRYWHHPESKAYFSTEPGERITDLVATECVELTRYEFISRQSLHFGYEDRL